MIEKFIEYKGNQYIRNKKIKGKNKTYVEYKNEELSKKLKN